MGHISRSLIVAICALGLAGCVESMPDFQANAGNIRSTFGGASPRGATVAMESLDGAPDAVTARFDRVFAKAAAARDITMAEPSTAHYLVRGYLDAASADDGTTVTYVYDIFDANDQQRVNRVTDVLTLPTSGGDAWAQVDNSVMASLAGRSADALAAALADTPAAKAALAPTITAAQ